MSTTSISSFDSDHTSDATWSLSSGSSRSNSISFTHTLPPYTAFLSSLEPVDPSTLSPGAECPICRVTYSTATRTPAPRSESQTAQLFNTLPLLLREEEPANYDNDRAVTLPCSGAHVIGEACWAREGGNTCPFCRERLFYTRHGYDNTSELRYENYPRSRGNIETLQQTGITRGINITTWLPVIRWPRTSGYIRWGREARAFSRYLGRILEDIPLDERGRYPGFALLLLDPILPHVFAILYRLIHILQGREMPAVQLVNALQGRIDQYLRDYAAEINRSQALDWLVANVISMWVAQELMMTELRREMGEDEDDALFTPHRWEEDLAGYRFEDVDAFGRPRNHRDRHHWWRRPSLRRLSSFDSLPSGSGERSNRSSPNNALPQETPTADPTSSSPAIETEPALVHDSVTGDLFALSMSGGTILARNLRTGQINVVTLNEIFSVHGPI
ncbi:hypothetical protein CC80DRAFT_581264 [Byssothecium circinans]|uniref:RING-type domain-containing protein n=1 Tax=Byssothecium circinans TaxID=147558 RepID=A0A6A5TAN2_9PLEO|nr:hypothetical protein CC80DRAFT_581264 [Byssothecium circinans]